MRARPATSLLLLLVVTGLLLAAVPAMAQAATPTPGEARMAARINGYRASLGLRRLKFSPIMQAEARWYAADMATHHYFNYFHIDSLGRTLAQRIKTFGSDDPEHDSQISLSGPSDADQAFVLFRDSPAHDHALRFPWFRTIGVGAAADPTGDMGTVWVVSFGQTPPPGGKGGRFSVTIQLPRRLRVGLRPCRSVAYVGRRCVVAYASKTLRGAVVQVQRRRHNRWVRSPRPVRRTAVLVLGPGAAVRVRVVARGRPGSPGPWRTLRGARR